MAQEIVELVARIYDRLLERDYASFFESLAPDIEWDETGGPSGGVFPDGAVLRGVPALTRFLRSWVESWEEIRWHPRDFQGGRQRRAHRGHPRARTRRRGGPALTPPGVDRAGRQGRTLQVIPHARGGT